MVFSAVHRHGKCYHAAWLRFGITSSLVVLGAWLPGRASAQVELSIAPGVLEAVCDPGIPKTFTFKVVSTSASNMLCSVGVTPVDVSSNGIPTPAVWNGLPDLSGSVEFTPKSFRITAGKCTQTLSATVTLPRGTTGGRYAMISCSAASVAQPSQSSNAGYSVVPEVRAVILITAKGAGSIANLTPASIGISSGREMPAAARAVWTGSVTIRNTGNCHVTLSGKLVIRSLANRIIDSAPLEGGRGLVFPGREREFKAVGRKVLPDGSYQAEMQMVSRGSTQIAREPVYLTVTNGAVAITGTVKPALPG